MKIETNQKGSFQEARRRAAVGESNNVHGGKAEARKVNDSTTEDLSLYMLRTTCPSPEVVSPNPADNYHTIPPGP
jgi:hypothetical protein